MRLLPLASMKDSMSLRVVEVRNPDPRKVDEIGWVDVDRGGGHGAAGWANMSTIELYAKAVPR
jgi:hypothetical protein